MTVKRIDKARQAPGWIMRVSREQAQKNRQAVLSAAARLFRRHGIEGVSVADVMQAAGLTHGGFYGQFASKDDLAVQAAAHAVHENAENWMPLMQDADDPWGAFKRAYLSSRHCQHPEAGCALSALAVEASRRGTPLKKALTDGVRSMLDAIACIIPRKRGKTPRDQAVIALSAMVGALILARAVDDEALGEELLETVRQGI